MSDQLIPTRDAKLGVWCFLYHFGLVDVSAGRAARKAHKAQGKPAGVSQ